MPIASAESKEVSFRAGLSPPAIRAMAEFVKKEYLEPAIQALSGHSYRETWSRDGRSVELEWGFPSQASLAPGAQPTEWRAVRLTVAAGSASIDFPGLTAADERGVAECRRVADEVEVVLDTFLARAKTTSLYFIFSTGEERGERDVRATPSTGSETLRRLTSGNMMNLYVLILAGSFGLFFILGDSAILAVIAIQLVALFYSDRLALLVGRVRPTPARPRVTVVCVPISVEVRGEVAKFARSIVSEISERLERSVSRETLEGPSAAAAVQAVLERAGVKSAAEEIKVVTRDVYGLVKGVAERFGLPVPKIAIVNTIADNAAATGVSPGRSSITITAGSLEDLDDAQLSGVVGHELGHIRGRDSLILFAATFILYAGGLYLWFPVLLYLGFFYYIVVFAVVFAIGKVLETRADTESAAKLGEPAVLASALTNIGYRQLYMERYSHGARFIDWLAFDPHPPIYFRVQRLYGLAASGKKVGNTLLVSIRDCVSGFLHTFL